jgi:hypothetical protein
VAGHRLATGRVRGWILPISTRSRPGQLSPPTGSLRQLYSEDPRWAHDALRFREHLTEMLTLVARGATECKV